MALKLNVVKKPVAAPVNKFVPKDEEPGAPETATAGDTPDFDQMDRKELRAYIAEQELGFDTNKGMTDDDIREKIREVLGVEPVVAEPAAEPEPEPEPAEGTVDLEKMDRTELKAFINDQGLQDKIKVHKGLTDDDIRGLIAAEFPDAEPAAGDGAGEPAAEPEAEEPPAPRGKVTGKEEVAARKNVSAIAKWLYTGQDAEVEQKKAEAQRDTQFLPSFFVPEGEDRIVRFRSDKFVGAMYMYNVKVGKRWKKFTQPADGEEDLFSSRGLNPQYVYVYEVLDRNPYKDRAGKTHKDMPRYWLVSDKLHKQIQFIATKTAGGLAKNDFNIHREGMQQPVYVMTVDTSLKAPTADVMKQPRLSEAATMAKYFSPLSAEDQRRVLAGVSDDND